jgi:hypothetical protein
VVLQKSRNWIDVRPLVFDFGDIEYGSSQFVGMALSR